MDLYFNSIKMKDCEHELEQSAIQYMPDGLTFYSIEKCNKCGYTITMCGYIITVRN